MGIGNGGKNLAVVQMEQHVSVAIGCNEKNGAAPKVVHLFWKISAGTTCPHWLGCSLRECVDSFTATVWKERLLDRANGL